MTEPIDAVKAIHNAFRKDISTIDTAALAMAQGKVGLEAELERFRFFSEMLDWHAKGEELAIFPALEAVAPAVAEAYIMDHRGLDAATEELHAAYSSHGALETARAAAALKFHHDIHLGKEDAHLYRLFRERIPIPEQVKAIALMATAVPQERFPEAVAWMFPLMVDDDRENTVRVWQMAMPAPVFERVKPLIHKALGEEWAELTRRIPSLE